MSKPKITDFALTSRDLRKYRINLKEGIIDAIDADDHTRMMDAIERVGMFKEAMTVRPGSSKRSRLCSRRPSKEARKQHIEQVHRLQDFFKNFMCRPLSTGITSTQSIPQKIQTAKSSSASRRRNLFCQCE
ncbi:hypothetical protein [Burkholderia cepacia]|uniref:hypothetical protein n=1 Tax=Burkholderia cepacia TaxID=292 RepID=UPI000ADB7598|nr:hypothetical protein [Burkholderia cepacia]